MSTIELFIVVNFEKLAKMEFEMKEKPSTSFDSKVSPATPLISPDEEAKKKSSDRLSIKSKMKRNWVEILEIVFLILVYLLLLGVYAAVPTVFYIVKPIKQVGILTLLT